MIIVLHIAFCKHTVFICKWCSLLQLNYWCLRYKWDKNEKHLKPETGLLKLREGLKVFANLRPAVVLPQVWSVIMKVY